MKTVVQVAYMKCSEGYVEWMNEGVKCWFRMYGWYYNDYDYYGNDNANSCCQILCHEYLVYMGISGIYENAN